MQVKHFWWDIFKKPSMDFYHVIIFFRTTIVPLFCFFKFCERVAFKVKVLFCKCYVCVCFFSSLMLLNGAVQPLEGNVCDAIIVKTEYLLFILV